MESVRSVPEEGGGEEEEEGGELDHPFIAILILSGLHPNAAKVTDAKGRLPLAHAIDELHLFSDLQIKIIY